MAKPTPGQHGNPTHVDVAPDVERLFRGVKGVAFDADGAPTAPVEARGDSTSPPPLPFEGINSRGVVVEDLRCRGCGYEVRGLSMADSCPECGWSVARSASGALLINSPRHHLATLRLGTTLVVAATFGSFAAATLGAIVAVALAASTTWANQEVLELLGQGFTVVGAGIALYGWWIFSTPDPAVESREQPTAARRVLRTLTVLSLAMSVITLLLKSLSVGGVLPMGPALVFSRAGTTFTLGSRTEAILGLISLTSFLVGVAQTSAAMAYLATVALRIPARELSRSARRMVWLVWVLQVVLGIGPLVAVVMQLVYTLRARAAMGVVLAQHDALPPPTTGRTQG